MPDGSRIPFSEQIGGKSIKFRDRNEAKLRMEEIVLVVQVFVNHSLMASLRIQNIVLY